MWELDHKEGWAPKNWCLLIVVLEKTLERSLDNKEIKPVNPKRNQPWIGRTDAEAEAPILWPPNQRVNSLEKTLTLGKVKGRRRGGWQGMKWLDSITDSMEVNLSKLQETVKDREAWRAAIHGVGHNLTTEQQQIHLWQYGWTWGHYAKWNNSEKDKYHRISVQFSRSIVSDSLWLHGRSMPGLPVFHFLPAFTQIYVHWVSDSV